MQATCPECRKSNPETIGFCGHCGAPLALARVAPEAEVRPTKLVMAENHLQQAEALVGVHEHERALEECDAAIRLWPSLAGAHNLRGVILEELDREEEAVPAYREALCLDPGFDAAAENLRACETELQEARTRRATERVERRSQPIVEAPTELPAKPEAQVVIQPPEPFIEEPAEPPSMWVRILTAPLVAYMFLGTGLLFLVSKTESLAEVLAQRYGDSGLRGVKAREWHAREMWLPIAFPVTFPVLGIRALLMLWFAAAYVAVHLPLEGWKVVKALLGRAAVRLAVLLVAAWRWIARPLRTGWAWIVAAFDAAWAGLVSLLVAAWHWITRPIRAIGKWMATLLQSVWVWIAGLIGTVLGWITRPIRVIWGWIMRAVRAAWRWAVILLQWGFCGPLILLLTGQSKTWRLVLAMGVFTLVGLGLCSLMLLGMSGFLM